MDHEEQHPEGCTCQVVTMDSGVWVDDLGKHLRFAVTDLWVAITINILPVPDEQTDAQVSVLLSMVTGLTDLVDAALHHAMDHRNHDHE